MITEIIKELNQENGSNYKINVLKKHKDNLLLQRVLKLAYDRVKYNFGITMKNISFAYNEQSCSITLESALDFLENKLCTRELTGNAANDGLTDIFEKLSKEDAIVVEKIIGRDLKINLGKTNILKVFKGLMNKPVYMRCDVYSPKTSKNIKFPAIVQKKADGTYREFRVEDSKVTCQSRSGEPYEYPVIFSQLQNLPDGIYIGELTVRGITDRAIGNGLLNSLEPPHEDIIAEFWDYVTLEEYSNAANKIKNKTSYEIRFKKLQEIVLDFDLRGNLQVIPYFIVDTLPEALKITSDWMTQGFEGSILKDLGAIFRDGTSKEQLKLKICIELDLICTGFTEGTKGTKRESTFGAITFENSEGTIKGRCSGFTDSQLELYNSMREELIGKIMVVQFNDLSKAEGNDYYALSHPRFIEFRDDKTESDTLERAFELREMAITLGTK